MSVSIIVLLLGIVVGFTLGYLLGSSEEEK
jgi:hypothetical protein